MISVRATTHYYPQIMDNKTLLAAMEFSRMRLLDTLDGIEKSGQDMRQALAWRPAPGRAHIAWQAMHCAATHDRYYNTLILGSTPKDETLVKNFAGGSTPSDELVPSLDIIRTTLARTFEPFKLFVSNASASELSRNHKLANGTDRSVAESIMLLTWHEAHHQGQIHLTWNCYKAAHGL
ncbi:MAG TPA: DinB family protein [Tepidisphaeraceae bacterium]|nr:DinB family protein [Tepidisphaeraceae bacterium]